MSLDDTTNFLSAADQRALDALIDAGLDPGAVAPDDRTRARRVHDLLGLAAGTTPAISPDLVQRLLQKVAASAPVAPSFTGTPRLALTEEAGGPELVPDDEEALDAYVMAGYKPEKVTSSLRPRAVQLDRLGSLIAQTPVAPGSADLVQRTLAAVGSARAMRPATDHTPSGRSGGFRLADMVSLAAALVLGVSVLWPVLATYRVHASRSACAANMATIATGFGQYAGDHRDSLPMATASLGGSWWHVGTTPERSNSANLYELPRNQYVRPIDMACAGNPKADQGTTCGGRRDWSCHESVSYSYHVMFGAERPMWGERSAAGPMVILADKSPVVARAKRGEKVNSFENSPNHGGAGQWALRTDGSAVWLPHPQLGDDNIWLPGLIDVALMKARAEMARGTPVFEFSINGNEVPDSRHETFVGP